MHSQVKSLLVMPYNNLSCLSYLIYQLVMNIVSASLPIA